MAAFQYPQGRFAPRWQLATLVPLKSVGEQDSHACAGSWQNQHCRTAPRPIVADINYCSGALPMCVHPSLQVAIRS
eukprot:3971626-Pleurochrysis_carterae.AAC.1